jgi:hypothetical protein
MAVLFGFRHPLALATSHRLCKDKQASVCLTPRLVAAVLRRAPGAGACARGRQRLRVVSACRRALAGLHTRSRAARDVVVIGLGWLRPAATGVRTCGAAATRGTAAGNACGASAAKRLRARRPLRVSALAPRARASSARGFVVLNAVGFAAERRVGAERALGAGRARCGLSRRRHSVGACGL